MDGCTDRIMTPKTALEHSSRGKKLFLHQHSAVMTVTAETGKHHLLFYCFAVCRMSEYCSNHSGVFAVLMSNNFQFQVDIFECSLNF